MIDVSNLEVIVLTLFNSYDLISNSPYCLPYDSHYASLENLLLDQQIFQTFFFILITCLLDIVLIL